VLSLRKLPSVKVEACHIKVFCTCGRNSGSMHQLIDHLYSDDPNVNLGRVMSSADTLVVMTVMLRCARFLADTAQLPY